jgi:hypothetical protein
MHQRRYVAIHEAGHAVVAMALGKDMHELRITEEGGGYCQNYAPRRWRSWHAASSLGGVFAGALYARDWDRLEECNNWEHCCEDLRLFNADRGGMTFRQGRRICLEILRERKAQLLKLADVLERDGFVDFRNCPR